MNNLIKKDLKYIWHPYTQMKEAKKLPPILITKANGLKLYDDKGNWYYDTISSWWCNIFGHNNKTIKNAIKKQIDSLEHVLFAGFTHKPAIELAECLTKITPKNLSKVFYSDNGSTAVEVSLKMSYQYWQNIGIKTKKKFVCLDYAYHGDTIGAMSVGGPSIFNEKFKGMFFKSYKAKSPYCYKCPMKLKRETCKIECVSSLENILKKHHREISGIIIEPLVLGAGGIIIYPKEYLSIVGQMCKKYNVHLIVDEVATGFGRTGRMFATDYVKNLKIDFMCLSKGITSGYLPISVTMTTKEIYNAFYDDYKNLKTFYHGHTYTANPIACSAALSVLKMFNKKTINQDLIKYFHKNLKPFKNLKIVRDVRYIGFIAALELKADRSISQTIYKEGLIRHLLLRPLGNITYLYLPLIVTKKEIDYILKHMYEILENIKSK